jgi:predicted transporter
MLSPLVPIERRVAKEVSMDEVFPVLAGIALGLATFTLRRMWLRIAVVGILGVALGAVASRISGELAVSRLYVLVDAAQVIVAALLTGALVRMWLRRRARSVAH